MEELNLLRMHERCDSRDEQGDVLGSVLSRRHHGVKRMDAESHAHRKSLSIGGGLCGAKVVP